MKFSIYTLNDNGSGIKHTSGEQFLHQLSSMIDDCATNGGTYFSVEVDADAPCFACGGCPLGGDITNDCADCAYSNDYHYVNGECISRHI